MEKWSASIRHNDALQGSNYVCPSCFHLLRRRCFAPDGFDAVSVQNVGSTYIIVSWDLPTHSNGILINFSLYCNGALAGVLPLTVISYDTTGLLLFTLYMYITLSFQPSQHEKDSPPGGPPDPESDTMTLSSADLLIRSLTLTSPLAPRGAYCPQTFMTPTSTVVYVGLGA
ncbi:hypothetical protein EMCRGX_G006116 [Ephydatia muelleri]